MIPSSIALLLTFTTTETGTTDGSDSLDGCPGNNMCTGDILPQILSPHDGDEVTSPFMLEGSLGADCYCDTCGCYYTEAYASYVRADGETVAEGQLPIEVSLPVGTYELTLSNGFHASEPITITVVDGAAEGGSTSGDPTSGDPTSGESTSGDGSSTGDSTSGLTGSTSGSGDEVGDAPAQDEDGGKGCGCSAAGGPPLAAPLLLGLLGLGLARRRE